MARRAPKQTVDARQGDLFAPSIRPIQPILAPPWWAQLPSIRGMPNDGLDSGATHGTYMGVDRSAEPMWRTDVPASSGAFDHAAMRRARDEMVLRQHHMQSFFVGRQWFESHNQAACAVIAGIGTPKVE